MNACIRQYNVLCFYKHKINQFCFSCKLIEGMIYYRSKNIYCRIGRLIDYVMFYASSDASYQLHYWLCCQTNIGIIRVFIIKYNEEYFTKLIGTSLVDKIYDFESY